MSRRAMGIVRLLATALVSVILVACAGDDMRDLREYVEDVKARKAGRIEPLPEIKQIETFVYNASEQRNPFSPSEAEEEAEEDIQASGLHPDPLRRKEELEGFPLDTIRMVGTLEQRDAKWALVQTRDGTIHRVRPGNYLGQNHGKIVQILDDRIELTEIVPDRRGGYVERQASLALNE